MAAVTLTIQGGQQIKAYLEAMAVGLESASEVRVGFLEGEQYATTDRLARFRRGLYFFRTGKRLPLSRFDSGKPSKTLTVAQVAFWNEFGTVRAKARPFMRRMIASKSPRWGARLAQFLKASDYDAGEALVKLGILIKEQLQESIRSWPADNRPLHVALKGFNKGLTDSATMARAVDFEVTRG